MGDAPASMLPIEAWLRAQIYRCARAFRAAKRHCPKWLLALVGIALAIPGPQDELLVLLILAAWAAFKPAMRADIRSAWNIYEGGVWQGATPAEGL